MSGESNNKAKIKSCFGKYSSPKRTENDANRTNTIKIESENIIINCLLNLEIVLSRLNMNYLEANSITDLIPLQVRLISSLVNVG